MIGTDEEESRWAALAEIGIRPAHLPVPITSTCPAVSLPGPENCTRPFDFISSLDPLPLLTTGD